MSRVSGLAERIRLLVLRGEVPAGGWLVDVRLAQEFEVPRSRVREALRLLEGQGLLVADEEGGMRAAAPSAADVAELLAVRAALEALCAAAAARRGLAVADAERLRELATGPMPTDRAMGRSAGTAAPLAPGSPAARRAAVLADRAFHRALCSCADQRAAFVVLDRTWDRLVVGDVPGGPLADHAELVQLVAAGDEDGAGDLARRHALHSE